jgi:hypothetical protein
MRAVWLIIITPVALMALSAQGDYSLSGTVRNSVTGEPIKGAMVTLSKIPGQTEGPVQPEVRTTLAGSNGEYSFTGLSKGQYFRQAQKPGFVVVLHPDEPDEDNTVSIPSSAGVAVNLTPLGVIEGTAVNQYGDPMRNVTLALFQSSWWMGNALSLTWGPIG